MTQTDIPARVPLVTQPMGVWQSLQTARKNLIEIIPDIATKQPMITGKTAIVRWHMVMDPDGNRRVLKDNLENYPKSDVTKNILEPAIGKSLFNAEGAHWRWQRRAATPVFTHRNIANLAPIMGLAADRSTERLAQSSGRAVDLFQEMVAATFEVISDVTFSGDEGFDRMGVHTAIDNYIAQTAKLSLFDIVGVPTWVPRPSRMISSGAIKQMKAIADNAINNRRDGSSRDVPDLLDLLLEGEDPKTKRQMTTAELRDNLLTFIVAGHETTALTLAWSLYLCAFDQDVQDKARAEAQSVLNGSTANADDVPKLKYIRQIIDEALRLYPPAALLSRTAQSSDTLCGRDIRKGDTVILPIYALHRNHLLWENPDHFDPDRFVDPKAINRFAYLPFGDGPRICIGASFALQEAVIILATLISRFRFKRVPGKDPKPVLILTLRPEGGVWLDVERIDGKAGVAKTA
ncbi:cytochrome P450 [Parasulfitobacter algicola]|uniref:Cytochrome P450 n=1 Tax=Parasulfitobacter algicola TaxID=2614809 RepID=A0ABX2IV29_9RHOB|nr:cytochrome P450 [Sulfitobacter algicola]NSX53903.1 cytochrome P450 [Sulfitobacter algicola]